MSVWGSRALEALLWWGICFGIWLLSLSSLAGDEILLAALVALPCGALAVAARVAAGHAYTVRPSWLLPALALPLTILTDTVQVLASAVRGRPGSFQRVRIRGAQGHGVLPEGRRALASFLITVTPGSFLAEIDPESGEALVHVVAERGPSMHELAAR